MYPIDFVITWVDGSDPEWLAEKAEYSGVKGDSRNLRYRDWGMLKYWFRCVEKYAPWVNKIYFITWGHVPKWLNLGNEKLVIVNHKDYIPKKYLPTFSSRAIDMNFHRIKELSEHFVYFNDDMYITAPVKPNDFFKKGLPCDTAILNPCIFGGSNDAVVYAAAAFSTIPINQYFNKKIAIKTNLSKWVSPAYGLGWFRTLLLLPWRGFPGFMNYHIPYSYLKSTYSDAWEKSGDYLDETCMHKFRQNSDCNHWVFNYWQIASGKFYPRNPKIGQQYGIYDEDSANCAANDINAHKYKFVCLNDDITDNCEHIVEILTNTFDRFVGEKSSFELE